ncbi:type II toxin-antitoxin system YafO family toxin [Marinimicrobium locisalis]|uniref:type II toxin-antitoxin system YafO family toxin n=1 Tax=Marinimicrobium locisalis TaxID=546022 RepID=UPI003D2FC291
MGVKVFLHSAIRSHSEAEFLRAAFRTYKETDDGQGIFGRDGDYVRPKQCREEELRHVHLRPQDRFLLRKWLKRKNPYHQTSDKHLVYCSGFHHRDTYLLIAVLEPKAHDDARNIDLMAKLAEIASEFRLEY